MTKSGNLVYTDYDDRTVNILKNTQIQEVIKFEEWRPYGVCISFSGDIFVIIDSCDKKKTNKSGAFLWHDRDTKFSI